jgi:hypothetical protein
MVGVFASLGRLNRQWVKSGLPSHTKSLGGAFMNAVSVGIDVSKGKSTVAAMLPFGEVLMSPQEFPHTEVGLERLAETYALPFRRV